MKNTMRSLVALIIMFIIFYFLTLFIGAFGIHYLMGSSWGDSFYDAALIISSISIEIHPVTPVQKFFIAVYVTISIAVYLVLVSAFIALLLEVFLFERIHDFPIGADLKRIFSYKSLQPKVDTSLGSD